LDYGAHHTFGHRYIHWRALCCSVRYTAIQNNIQSKSAPESAAANNVSSDGSGGTDKAAKIAPVPARKKQEGSPSAATTIPTVGLIARKVAGKVTFFDTETGVEVADVASHQMQQRQRAAAEAVGALAPS
jgi:hypothetical protein